MQRSQQRLNQTMRILEFHVRTTRRCQLLDITREAESILRENNLHEGIVTIFTPHTTAGITINENADPDVTKDLLFGLEQLAPDRPEFRHAEGNSDAHIKSSLVGASETVFFSKGQFVLGTWQSIYFCEFDGPRQRRVQIGLYGG